MAWRPPRSGCRSRPRQAAQPVDDLVRALDRAQALLRGARVGCLAAEVDVDVDPPAVAHRELEPGADLDDAE